MADIETPQIRRIRRRIDALDRKLVELVNERARLGIAAGDAKRAAGRRTVRDPEREADVLARVSAANTGPLPDAEVIALYRRLIAATRRLEAARREAIRATPGDPPVS